jgi:glutaconate CoA-transferase subunit B
MDFGGPENAIRVVFLHPGVSFAEVQEATGFELVDAVAGETPATTQDQLEIIDNLDPHGIRNSVIKDNPPARRAAA